MKFLTFGFALLLLMLSIGGYSRDSRFKIKVYSDTTIGTKLNDSTGQLTMSSAGIQENILPTISSLNGAALSTSMANLVVNPTTAYLILKGTNSSGNSMLVAIQLVVEGTKIIYRKDGHSMVHICINTGSCAECEFVKQGDIILTCKCPSQGLVSPSTSLCQDHSAKNK